MLVLAASRTVIRDIHVPQAKRKNDGKSPDAVQNQKAPPKLTHRRPVGGGGDPGGDDFIFTPFARGWHLNRRRFDELLLGTAQSRGVNVFHESSFRSATRTPSGWKLALHSGEYASYSVMEAELTMSVYSGSAVI
jgi:flavin-dependent dehydrogenase